MSRRTEFEVKKPFGRYGDVEIETCDRCRSDLVPVDDVLPNGKSAYANGLEPTCIKWQMKRNAFGYDLLCSTCYDEIHNETEDLRYAIEVGREIRWYFIERRMLRANVL